jgi:N-acetylglutamate synthase-like GNAT family acetyltransferase
VDLLAADGLRLSGKTDRSALHPFFRLIIRWKILSAENGSQELVVTTRRAYAEDLERIAAFYRHHDYRPAISPADVIVMAENEGTLCGVVRLCEEHGVLVLRGMRVSEGRRWQGIGTRLLQAVEPLIGERECFCLPHRHLRSFYGRIGFAEIAASEAPAFLQERCTEYRRDYGLDVIIMRRPKPGGVA